MREVPSGAPVSAATHGMRVMSPGVRAVMVNTALSSLGAEFGVIDGNGEATTATKYPQSSPTTAGSHNELVPPAPAELRKIVDPVPAFTIWAILC